MIALRYLMLCTAAVLSACALAQESAPIGPIAEPATGEHFEAALAGVDGQGRVLLKTATGTRSLLLDDLLFWGEIRQPRGVVVLLGNSDLLAVESAELSATQLKTQSYAFGPLDLDRQAVAGVVLNAPELDEARDAAIHEVARWSGDADMVRLVNGDELTGQIVTLQNEILVLASSAGNVNVPMDSIVAVALQRSGTIEPSLKKRPLALVAFVDGSRLTANELAIDSQKARLTTTSGLELSAMPDEISALMPHSEKVVYLSDLKPAGFSHVPFLELGWPYKLDQNVLGGTLRSGGRTYLKGIGVHSASGLTYKLDGEYARFQAELAIDDSAHERGSVIFKIFADDGSRRWQPKYTSPVIRGGMPPVPVNVDVAGAKRLSLLVEFADRGDELDHANWLQARLIK